MRYGQPGHDDVIKWKYFPRCWSFVRGIHRSTVNSPHKGQWRGALIFIIYVHTNGWVNYGDAGGLRRHRVHNDVAVMYPEGRQPPVCPVGTGKRQPHNLPFIQIRHVKYWNKVIVLWNSKPNDLTKNSLPMCVLRSLQTASSIRWPRPEGPISAKCPRTVWTPKLRLILN